MYGLYSALRTWEGGGSRKEGWKGRKGVRVEEGEGRGGRVEERKGGGEERGITKRRGC